MTAKEYLSQLATLKRRIGFVEDRIRELESDAMSPKAIRYDKINVQQTASGDAFANYAAKAEEERSRLYKLKGEYIEKRNEIRKKISKVTPFLYADVLYMRYVDGMKLREIADDLNCVYETACRWHGKALKIFEKCNKGLFGHC